MQLLFYYLLASKVALKSLNGTCSSHLRWIGHRPMGCEVLFLLGWMRSMLVCDISLPEIIVLVDQAIFNQSGLVGMVLSPIKDHLVMKNEDFTLFFLVTSRVWPYGYSTFFATIWIYIPCKNFYAQNKIGQNCYDIKWFRTILAQIVTRSCKEIHTLTYAPNLNS